MAGVNTWSDQVDFRSLPSALAAIAAPTSASTLHLDLFAGNTGGRVLSVQLVDASGQTSYFNDSLAICDTASLHSLNFSSDSLIQHDFSFQLNDAQWDSSVAIMYWLVRYVQCGAPAVVYASSGLVSVTIRSRY